MADVTTPIMNGNGLHPCGAMVQSPPPVIGNVRCGTVWGPDPNFLLVPGATVADLVFPRMTQFLGQDPNRIGLVLRSQFSGVRIATSANGLGVPLVQTFGNAPGAGGQFEVVLWAGPGLFIGAAWYWAVCDTAGAPIGLDQLLSWMEIFKV